MRNASTTRLALLVWLCMPACAERPEQGSKSKAQAAAQAPATPKPDSNTTLIESDLVVLGIRVGDAPGTVRSSLGQPDATESGSAHVGGGPDAPTIAWRYHRVSVYFVANRVDQIHITAPGVPTARGLQVGDAESRVRSLYGGSLQKRRDEDYYEGTVDEERGILISVANGRVSHITVGIVVEVD